MLEEFEDTKHTKGVIRIRKSWKDRQYHGQRMLDCLMVSNATFYNISVILWRTDMSQVTDKLYHIMLCTSPEQHSNKNVSGDRQRLHR